MNNRWIIVSVSEPKERRVYEVVSVRRHQFVTSSQKEKQPHEVVALLLEVSVVALLSAHLPDNRPKTAVISRNRLFLNNQTHTLFFSFVSLLIEKFFDEFLSLHEPSSLVPSFSRICTNCSMNERRPVVRHGGPTTNRHDFINRLRRHDVFAWLLLSLLVTLQNRIKQ